MTPTIIKKILLTVPAKGQMPLSIFTTNFCQDCCSCELAAPAERPPVTVGCHGASDAAVRSGPLLGLTTVEGGGRGRDSLWILHHYVPVALFDSCWPRRKNLCNFASGTIPCEPLDPAARKQRHRNATDHRLAEIETCRGKERGASQETGRPKRMDQGSPTSDEAAGTLLPGSRLLRT